MASVSLRVLTWNLLHGRSVPSAGRELFEEFASALEGWTWDLALLQEVPPWWPPTLGRRMRADARTVLTSRNSLLPLRRSIAVRWPDVIKSNGGGANTILVRAQRIEEHRTFRLRTWPERRQLQAVRLQSGVWVGNLHAGGLITEARRAARMLGQWAEAAPAILGGDFNLRPLSLSAEGFAPAGGHGVDLVFARNLVAASPAEILERGRLSDHVPVAVTLTAPQAS